MTQTKIAPTEQEFATLEELVSEIDRFEHVIARWDESQQAVVAGLKHAIEALHKEALTRLIRSVKQDSMPALRHAVEDKVVYGLLRYHDLIKPPQPPLEERIQRALDEVRPGLMSHNGDVELVDVELPDTVKVRLVGTCSNCPASTLTMKQGVEQAIKQYCPEITNVISVNTAASSQKAERITSPFAFEQETVWAALCEIDEIPDGGILALEVEGLKLIVCRTSDRVMGYRNSCTHLAMPLDTGEVEKGILTCPFHGFQYRLETGECLTAPEMPLQPHPVKRQGDRVFARIL